MIDKELVKSKLSAWTLSSKVQEVLGLSSMDEALFKKELSALESSGVIERSGERRGLKFRYKLYSSTETTQDDVKEEESDQEEKEISEVASYLQQREHDKKQLQTSKSFLEMLDFVITSHPSNDPTITSYTLSIKKVSDGSIIVKTYMGIIPLQETKFSSEAKFMSFLHKSGLFVNDSTKKATA